MLKYNGYVIGKGGYWLKPPEGPAFPGMTSWDGSYGRVAWGGAPEQWGFVFRKIVPSRDVRLVSWSTVEAGAQEPGDDMARGIFDYRLPTMNRGSTEPWIPDRLGQFLYGSADYPPVVTTLPGVVFGGRNAYMYTNNCDILLEEGQEYWIPTGRFHDSILYTGGYDGVAPEQGMEFMWMPITYLNYDAELQGTDPITTVYPYDIRPYLRLVDADGNVVYS